MREFRREAGSELIKILKELVPVLSQFSRRKTTLFFGVVIAVAGSLLIARYREHPLPIATECLKTQSAAQRLAPFAKGQLAALTFPKQPTLVPPLAFKGANGQPISLSDLKGKLLLLNLWATWCVPCREEMPALDALQTAFGGSDFEVVAVNVDTFNLERPAAWLRDNGIHNLAFYADPSGSVLQSLQRSGDVVGLPSSLLIDANGCTIAVLKGPASWDGPEARSLVATALNK